jgi:WD40 repeat protein
MSDSHTGELYFILAKFLRSIFPAVGAHFIAECESHNLFPPGVFSETTTFDELDSSLLARLPDDQLLKILSAVNLMKSSGPCPAKAADLLLHQIGPAYPMLCRFNARERVVGHLDDTYCLATDFTSQVLVTGSDDSRIKFWKLPELVLIKTLCIHSQVVTDINIDPSNRYVASSSHDRTICLVDLAMGSVISRLQRRKEVHSIKFSPCGRWLGAACEEGLLAVWEVESALAGSPETFAVDSPGRVPAAWLSFSPGGEFVVFSADKGTIRVISLTTRAFFDLVGHEELPDFVFFSRISCRRILSVSLKEKQAKTWTIGTRGWENVIDFSAKLPSGVKHKPRRVLFNSDESRIIAASPMGVLVWATQTGDLLVTCIDPELTDQCSVIAPHPSLPNVVFVGTATGKTSLWDVFTGKLVSGLIGPGPLKITEAIWSPDGRFVLVSDRMGGITLYTDVFHSTEFIPSTDMFFDGEFDPGLEDVPTNGCLTDRFRHPLSPQPTRPQLSDLRLAIMAPAICPTLHREEHAVLKLVQTAAVRPAGSIDRRRRQGSAPSRTAPPRETDPTQENPPLPLLETDSTQHNALPLPTTSDEGFRNTNSTLLRRDLPEWMTFTRRFNHSFFPQLGERIAYSRKGHLEWIEDCQLLQHTPPYEVQGGLAEIAFADVASLEPAITHLIVKLQFDDFTAFIDYPVPQCPPFITSEAHFHRSLNYIRKLRVGSVVEMEFDEDGTPKLFKAVLEGLSPDWKENPYNCTRVKFLDDQTHGSVPPWDLLFDEEQTPAETKMMQLSESVLAEVRQISLTSVYRGFLNCRSAEQRKRLLRESRFPSDLKLIVERLQNCYYATVESLIADVRQMASNAKLLGLKKDLAVGLVTNLLHVIEEFARQLDIPIRDWSESDA